MILVDTSVLIDFFRRRVNAKTDLLLQLEESHEPYFIPALCAQEILQGSATTQDWKRMLTFLNSQDLVVPKDPIAHHIEAARIYFDCRRKGFTIRSTVDCLVAQLAIENSAHLLHSDRDYENIRLVRPGLKVL